MTALSGLSQRNTSRVFQKETREEDPAGPPSALDEPRGLATVRGDLQADTWTRLWCEPFVKIYIGPIIRS